MQIKNRGWRVWPSGEYVESHPQKLTVRGVWKALLTATTWKLQQENPPSPRNCAFGVKKEGNKISEGGAVRCGYVLVPAVVFKTTLLLLTLWSRFCSCTNFCSEQMVLLSEKNMFIEASDACCAKYPIECSINCRAWHFSKFFFLQWVLPAFGPSLHVPLEERTDVGRVAGEDMESCRQDHAKHCAAEVDGKSQFHWRVHIAGQEHDRVRGECHGTWKNARLITITVLIWSKVQFHTKPQEFGHCNSREQSVYFRAVVSVMPLRNSLGDPNIPAVPGMFRVSTFVSQSCKSGHEWSFDNTNRALGTEHMSSTRKIEKQLDFHEEFPSYWAGISQKYPFRVTLWLRNFWVALNSEISKLPFTQKFTSCCNLEISEQLQT